MASPDTTVVDDRVVSRRLSDGSVERVRWKDLVEVRVLAADDAGADLRFVLLAADGTSCVVAQGAAPATLVDRLQRLPGFDSGALLEAMVASDGADLRCWAAPAPA